MNFLTACAPCDSQVFLESESGVKGLCIQIRMELINEAFTIVSGKYSADPDNILAGYFNSGKFFENVYSAQGSELGNKLLSIWSKYNSEGKYFSFINDDIFLELAEIVIRHESGYLRNLNSLSSLKSNTKKEILRRLIKGREFIDDNFRKKIGVKEIAGYSCLSEFHFFRSFKEAFGITPHNYLIRKRLNAADKLLRDRRVSIGEIAFECGFADIHSFSKSYKKQFGVPPSKRF